MHSAPFCLSTLLLVVCLFHLGELVSTDQGQTEATAERAHRHKRAHPSGISAPQTENERRAIQGVINLWNHWNALGRGPGEIYHYVSGSSRARIDLQGVEHMGGSTFERFAVQIGSYTYAVVHIQRGVTFGVALIRNAFEESRDHRAHVFLTNDSVTQINAPGDGNNYSSRRQIRRKWNGSWNTVWVWSVADAVSHMANKFNRG